MCRGHVLLMILMEIKLLDLFTKENCKKKKTKKKQKELRNEKVIKRKGEKLHVKWKGYNNSFNSGIDKKGSTNDRIFSKLEIFKSKCES